MLLFMACYGFAKLIENLQFIKNDNKYVKHSEFQSVTINARHFVGVNGYDHKWRMNGFSEN